MFINETWINKSEGHGCGESDLYEPFTDDLGRLYRALVKEYGRCTGRVYVDTKEGSKAVGWVFLKRKQYDDAAGTFLLETWVTLHENKPDTQVTHHYKYL